MTGVDLALLGVILFLLTMLTLRMLWGLEAPSSAPPSELDAQVARHTRVTPDSL